MVPKGGNNIIYQALTLYIILFALFKIHTQYYCLAYKLQPLPLCTQQFTSIIGLLYVHRNEVGIII